MLKFESHFLMKKPHISLHFEPFCLVFEYFSLNFVHEVKKVFRARFTSLPDLDESAT